MLEYFPYIGGDAASGTKNLTEAYILVAMGEALRRYALLPILQKNMAMVSICRIYVILTMLCLDCCEFRFLGNIHVLRMEITVILS